jgi:hypothetical protein
MKVIGVRHLLLSLIILFGFSQTMGGYNGARFWSIVFLVFTALAHPSVEQLWVLGADKEGKNHRRIYIPMPQ